MRVSRVGILILFLLTVLVGANCSYYSQIVGRKNLVDGARAYKDRNLQEAEELFRTAVSRDPEGKTEEGRVAQLFLARTLHSQYIGSRSPLFGESDFLGDDGTDFAEKISKATDPLSQFLWSQVSPEAKGLLENYKSKNPSRGDEKGVKEKNDLRKQFLNQLGIDLNKVIGGGQSIYDEGRFANVKLSDFTKQFMAQNPTGDNLTRLNRLLLEDAYPDEIVRKPKPEEAIEAYKKSLNYNINDHSSFRSVANLYENLRKDDEWLKWMTDRSNNEQVKPEFRADAYAALAAKKYTCASEISDADAVKKTVKKDGKDVFQFTKPEKPEDFDKFKQCVQEGLDLTAKAVPLEIDRIKQMKDVDPAPMTDREMNELGELIDIYQSVWSYRASMLAQAMRLAEMEGRNDDKDRFKTESDAARDRYLELNNIDKKLEAEKEKRRVEQDPAANKDNTNAAK